MSRPSRLWSLTGLVAWALFTGIGSAVAASFPPLLFAAEGAQRILEYGPDGRVVWEHPAAMARDVWRLTNGNALFCFNDRYDSSRQDNPSGVLEVTRDHRIVFQFLTTGQVWSCQRLTNGLTLVAAASQGQLLLVAPNGQIARQIKLRNAPGHSCLRNARQLPNGHFLVAEESAHAAREYDPQGSLTREIKVSFAPYSVIRQTNGNTLICGQQSIVEIAPDDHVVWSCEGKDFPQAGIRWFAGLQVLPNGNLFVCNAGGRVTFLELNRAKQIVWQSDGSYPIGHGIQRLDLAGPWLK